MLVSIIMPSFNSGKTISTSIMSVLNQSYTNWELIVCDDGSTDDTLAIVRSIGDKRIFFTKNKYKKGAAGARNSGLDISRGEYITFLDSDDIWGPEKLKVQLEHMIYNQLDFTYGSYYTFTSEPENPLGMFIPPDSISFNKLLKSCDIGCLTVMIRKKSLDHFYFPLCPKEDYAAWIVCCKQGLEMSKYPGIHAYYRISNSSVSANKFKEVFRQYNVIRKFGGVNFIKACLYLSFYISNGLVKHKLNYKKNFNNSRS